MAVKTVSRNTQNGTSALTPGLPDLAWYRDVADRRKRNAHIKRLCAEIAREFNPEKIILFGSQAHGKPTAESDIDLLVVMPYEGSPFRGFVERAMETKKAKRAKAIKNFCLLCSFCPLCFSERVLEVPEGDKFNSRKQRSR